MVREDRVVSGNLEISDMGPDGLGYYTVIYDAACVAHFICEVSLGVPGGAAVEDGEIAVAAELE